MIGAASQLKSISRVVVATLACLGMTGCGLREAGGIKNIRAADAGFATTADWRTVLTRQNRRGQMITCAEPSPDVAKIASQTANAGLNASAEGIAKVQPELALTLAFARAESLAQLGKRLATIQLLRDALYRACEAYSNEAISPATYAMIVSRYDDVMITLLLGELASGERSAAAQAVLNSTASITGLPPASAEIAIGEAKRQLEGARGGLAAAQDALKAAEASTAPEPKRTEDIKTAKEAVSAARKDVSSSEAFFREVVSKVGEMSTTAGGTPAATDGDAPGRSDNVAGYLAQMQRAYLDDFNLDAVMVGCLSTLSKLDEDPSQNSQSAPLYNPEARRLEYRPVLGAEASVPNWNLQDECRDILADGSTLKLVSYAKAVDLMRRGGTTPPKPDDLRLMLQKLHDMSREPLTTR